MSHKAELGDLLRVRRSAGGLRMHLNQFVLSEKDTTGGASLVGNEAGRTVHCLGHRDWS